MSEPTNRPDPSTVELGDQGWVKDEELESLFASGRAEHGPIDSHDLLPAVVARIAQRRRHRRTGLVVAAAAVALLGGAVATRFVGDDRDQVVTATDSPGLTITYDGHAYTFTEFTEVGCTTESGHEVLQAWFRPKSAIDGQTLLSPILSFDARPDLIEKHAPRFELPVAAGDSANNAFTLFAAVPVSSGRPQDDNEASSQQEGATGTVTVTDLTCGPHPTVTIAADAELGSEVSGPTIPIQGRITYPAP